MQLTFTTPRGLLAVGGAVALLVAVVLFRPQINGFVRSLDLPPDVRPFVAGCIGGAVVGFTFIAIIFTTTIPLQRQALIENGLCPFCAAQLASGSAGSCSRCGKTINP